MLGKQDPTETETRAFLEEAALMAQFDHPNIIRLVGVVTDAQPIMIVVELAEVSACVVCLFRLRWQRGGGFLGVNVTV